MTATTLRSRKNTRPRSNLDITHSVNIIQFTRDVLGLQLWPAQEAVLRTLYGLPVTGSTQRDFIAEATRKVYGTPRPPQPGKSYSELVAVLGRRSGKSRGIGVPVLVYESLRNWRPYLRTDYEYVFATFIAESMPQARDVLGNEITTTVLGVPMLAKEVVYHDVGGAKDIHTVESTNSEQLVLSNRSVIKALPPEKSKVRGRPIFCIVCDEIAWWRKEGLRADADVLQALKPSLKQFQGNAKLLKLSSPADKSGVLYDDVARAGAFRDRMIVFQAGTLACNPNISEADIEDEMLEDPIRAAIEYGAEFVDSIDSLVPNELLAPCVEQYEVLSYDQKNHYHAAMDPAGAGKITGDPLAFVVGHFDPDNRDVVVDCVASWEKTSKDHLPDILKEVKRLCDRYHCGRVFIDQWASEWVGMALTDTGLTPCREDWAPKKRTRCGEKLRGLIDQQRLRIPNNKDLVGDILSLERIITPAGQMTVKKPRRSHRHGDLADCLLILSSKLDRGPLTKRKPDKEKAKRDTAFSNKLAAQSRGFEIASGSFYREMNMGRSAAESIKRSTYYDGSDILAPDRQEHVA